MEQKNNLPAIQHREVVQSFLITTARYKFSVYEKRILSKLITHLQYMLEGQRLIGRVEKSLFGDVKVNIPIQFLTDGDTNYKPYQDALKALATKGIEYEDSKVWMFCNLIQSPKIKKYSGEVEFSICSEMVDLFLNFNKGYSKYIVEVSCNLSSVASARLYELISNQPKPLEYSLDKLRKLLDPNNTYPKTSNFMQRVIETAKKELDEKANWSFKYEPIKGGRKYIGLKLKPIHFANREPEEVQHADALRRVSLGWYLTTDVKNYLLKICGFTKREIKNNLSTIETFCSLYPTDGLNKIKDIWERAQTAKNPKGYLVGAIQNEIENN